MTNPKINGKCPESPVATIVKAESKLKKELLEYLGNDCEIRGMINKFTDKTGLLVNSVTIEFTTYHSISKDSVKNVFTNIKINREMA